MRILHMGGFTPAEREANLARARDNCVTGIQALLGACRDAGVDFEGKAVTEHAETAALLGVADADTIPGKELAAKITKVE